MYKYYLYRHIREDSNLPFYIGIGSINHKGSTLQTKFRRAFSKKRNQFWHNIVSKTSYHTEIIFFCNDLSSLFSKEIEFIKLYGRKCLNEGSLCNISEGGNSPNGCKRTPEYCQKLSKRWTEFYQDNPNPRSYKVFSYSLCGKLLSEYPSIRKMAKSLGISVTSARVRISKGLIKSYGVFLSTSLLSEISAKNIISNRIKEEADQLIRLKKTRSANSSKFQEGVKFKNISQLDKSGNLIKVWKDVKSIIDCFGGSRVQITGLLSGYSKAKSAFGFKWSL